MGLALWPSYHYMGLALWPDGSRAYNFGEPGLHCWSWRGRAAKSPSACAADVPYTSLCPYLESDDTLRSSDGLAGGIGCPRRLGMRARTIFWTERDGGRPGCGAPAEMPGRASGRLFHPSTFRKTGRTESGALAPRNRPRARRTATFRRSTPPPTFTNRLLRDPEIAHAFLAVQHLLRPAETLKRFGMKIAVLGGGTAGFIGRGTFYAKFSARGFVHVFDLRIPTDWRRRGYNPSVSRLGSKMSRAWIS